LLDPGSNIRDKHPGSIPLYLKMAVQYFTPP
jgi:hypothetical protein